MARKTDGLFQRFRRWLLQGEEPLDAAMQADLGRDRQSLEAAGVIQPPETLLPDEMDYAERGVSTPLRNSKWTRRS